MKAGVLIRKSGSDHLTVARCPACCKNCEAATCSTKRQTSLIIRGRTRQRVHGKLAIAWHDCRGTVRIATVTHLHLQLSAAPHHSASASGTARRTTTSARSGYRCVRQSRTNTMAILMLYSSSPAATATDQQRLLNVAGRLDVCVRCRVDVRGLAALVTALTYQWHAINHNYQQHARSDSKYGLAVSVLGKSDARQRKTQKASPRMPVFRALHCQWPLHSTRSL